MAYYKIVEEFIQNIDYVNVLGYVRLLGQDLGLDFQDQEQ